MNGGQNRRRIGAVKKPFGSSGRRANRVKSERRYSFSSAQQIREYAPRGARVGRKCCMAPKFAQAPYLALWRDRGAAGGDVGVTGAAELDAKRRSSSYRK